MRHVTIAPHILRQHLPLTQTMTVGEAHLDVMGHMNTQHYGVLFSLASRQLVSLIGVDDPYVYRTQQGAFMLKNFTQFIAEAHLNDVLHVRTRLIARGERRYHYMHFLLNETHDKLAATMEALTTHADLSARCSAAIPPEIAAQIDAVIAQHNAIDWTDAPLCGVLAP